jgi:hypothetical protein
VIRSRRENGNDARERKRPELDEEDSGARSPSGPLCCAFRWHQPSIGSPIGTLN